MDTEKINNESNEEARENEGKNESKKSVDNDKLWAALAYILFFIPLLKDNRSEFVNFHTNQGTLFFIFTAAGSIVLSIIPIIGWVLFPIFSVIVLVFFVLGLLNALGGKMKRLPWFGHLNIIN